MRIITFILTNLFVIIIQDGFAQNSITDTLSLNDQKVDSFLLAQTNRAYEDTIFTAFGIPKSSKSLTYAAQNINIGSLSEARSLNLLDGLSGKVAGLSYTTVGSGVGADARVILRGNRAVGGTSAPIFVVDGITLNDDISNLSPNDIESISIIKGANGAALYGSRAGNGAIIVTTKSGMGAREGVTANFGFTWQGSSAIISEKMQNRYGQGTYGVYAPDSDYSWGPEMTGQNVAHWSNDPSYEMFGKTYPFSPQPDNINDYFKMGNSMATNLHVNLKKGKTNAVFSYTNTNASGIIATNNLNSHNLNIRLGSNIGKRLTFDSKLSFIRQNFENQLTTGNSYNNPMKILYSMPRNIRTADIKHYSFINSSVQTRQHLPHSGNPYWTRYNIEQPETRDLLTGMVSLKYQVTKELSVLGRSAYEKSDLTEEIKVHNDSYHTSELYNNQKRNSKEWNSDLIVNYHKDINDFTIDLNAGVSKRSAEYRYDQQSGSSFILENVFAFSNCRSVNTEWYLINAKTISLFEFGEISYKGTYFLNITGRNDRDSRYPVTNRSDYYYSIGFAAIVNDIITLPSIFTQVKVRGSFSDTGDGTDPDNFLGEAIFMGNDVSQGTSKSVETGLDMKLFDDKARLSFTYFNLTSSNQLFKIGIPDYVGITYILANGPKVHNRGVELTIGANLISAKDYTWDIDFNWSKNTSKIAEISEGITAMTLKSDNLRSYRFVNGQQFGEVYSRGWLRDANGDVIIQPNGIPSVKSNIRIANFNPDWLGGISNTFRYRNFVFNTLIDIRHGGSFISLTENYLSGYGISENTESGRDGGLLFGENIFFNEKGVTSSGAPNTVSVDAETLWNNLYGVGEPFVKDASNVRMREMVLGYDLPESIISKTFFSSARISLVGRNLFFFSNKAKSVDPEVMTDKDKSSEGESSFALPASRTYGFSLNFGF